MRTWMIGLVISLVCTGCSMTNLKTTKAGRQTAEKLHTKMTRTVDCNYLLYLPENYNTSKERFPLILFLHGAGERGNKVSVLIKQGLPKMIANGKNFDFVIVSPQCPNDRWWPEPQEADILITLLNEIESKYKIDTDRVYLTGLSMGGFGTWTLAAEYPDRFAAIAPICGGSERISASRLKKVPVWAFHGAKDNVVPLVRSQEMVDAVKKAGGDAKLTVYPEATHDSWTETYNNPELYEWFLSHKLSGRKK